MRKKQTVLVITMAPLMVALWTADALPEPREAPQGDPPSYHLVVEMLDNDGVTHTEKVYDEPFFTLADAFTQAQKIHRSGFCFVLVDPPIPDPNLVALCFPPARILRTRVLLY